ncbi:MAG: hypothetical protein KDC87_21530 [Planctomycetes bacterium]|nr:hypothetical protein [Planctomycetota bacterium]
MHDDGYVTVAAETQSVDFPVTLGSYDARGLTALYSYDLCVFRMDPRLVGPAQLVYSTYLGGRGPYDFVRAMTVDQQGVVSLAGGTDSYDFPVTGSAYQQKYNTGGYDGVFVQLDPSAKGLAQLKYSSYLGGYGQDHVGCMLALGDGSYYLGGGTSSPNFPVTPGAYSGALAGGRDAFVVRFDPRLSGSAQVQYGTLLGGTRDEDAIAMDVDALGRIALAGATDSADFPTTSGARDRILSGSGDVFVAQLDTNQSGARQLAYASYLGGDGFDTVTGLHSDRLGRAVSLVGVTDSTNYPTTPGSIRSTFGGVRDGFLTVVEPGAVASAQLRYSTYLGGKSDDAIWGMTVDPAGRLIVGGSTASSDLPTTVGAYSRTYLGNGDVFVMRIDPFAPPAGQLDYSTYLGGSVSVDFLSALSVDRSQTLFAVGLTYSSPTPFPTTTGAFARKTAGNLDFFVCRLDMGIPMFADRHRLLTRGAGVQELTVQAGRQHAGLTFQIFGALSTNPGVTIDGVTIPLNPDAYTRVALSGTNSPTWTGFRGTLDANGEARASFRLPPDLISVPRITLYHALAVFDSAGKVVMASNAVPLEIGPVETR